MDHNGPTLDLFMLLHIFRLSQVKKIFEEDILGQNIQKPLYQRSRTTDGHSVLPFAHYSFSETNDISSGLCLHEWHNEMGPLS